MCDLWRPDETQLNLLYVRQLRSNQRMLVKGTVATDLNRLGDEIRMSRRCWKRASVCSQQLKIEFRLVRHSLSIIHDEATSQTTHHQRNPNERFAISFGAA
jgi:hypothetical protein